MKYLESYKLFERVTVPDFETTSDGNNSKGCGNCLAAKSGKPLISPPQQTFQGLDNYQNPARSRNEEQKKILFENNPGLEERINSVFKSAKNWYIEHYMKPETKKKFKKGGNRKVLVNFINNEIKLLYWNRDSVDKNSEIYKDWEKEYSERWGWVWLSRINQINLNMEKCKVDPDYKQTIPHELGHCIYLKLEQLGEDPISGNKDAGRSVSPNFRETAINPSLSDEESTEIKDIETYLTSEIENQTRLMRLRQLMNIGPRDTCLQIKQKFEKNIGNDKLKFKYLYPPVFVKKPNEDCYWLKFPVPDSNKKLILDEKYFIDGKPRLRRIHKALECSFDEQDDLDFPRLFSIFSQYRDGFIWLDLGGLTQLNIDVVRNDLPQGDQERRA